ncbi:hypothetical protein HAX54_016480 [Datura stramonium]|uniref:Uncharacterized protein n=1 Tax=Datura stramonium TaxID=4076 RepID=A0ABS8UL82_DATST|nr:hypothetical protein [Datura stramonium]
MVGRTFVHKSTRMGIGSGPFEKVNNYNISKLPNWANAKWKSVGSYSSTSKFGQLSLDIGIMYFYPSSAQFGTWFGLGICTRFGLWDLDLALRLGFTKQESQPVGVESVPRPLFALKMVRPSSYFVRLGTRPVTTVYHFFETSTSCNRDFSINSYRAVPARTNAD